MVAPYYFMFAHFHVAMAIELLPANERGEYRARVNELLLSVQGKDNGHGGGVEHGWNDRHFARSAGYGTAMALLALGMPDAPPPTPWIVPKKE